MVPPAEDDPSPTQGGEVVPYQPPDHRETRSHQDRIAKAAEGDLEARLALITVKAAEDGLARRFCKHQPDRSILSYLREPDDGVAPYQAASTVLEDLADQTEGTALESALVFRYVQAHALWKGHPNPAVRSAEDLVRHLDGGDYVQASIIIGTSAQAAKRNSVRLIDDCWGGGWFERVPIDIRDPSWRGPEECSKRILTQITANAKQGLSLEESVRAWREAIRQRNDYGARRRLGTKGRVTPFLIPSDIAKLNKVGSDNRRAGRTSDIFFPGDVKEDRLRVELVPPQSLGRPLTPKPVYSETATSKKRKRTSAVMREGAETVTETGEGWVESANGQWLTKRVRNQIIRRPMGEIAETDTSPTPSEEDGRQRASTLPQVETPAISRPSPPLQDTPVGPMDTSPRSTNEPHARSCVGTAFATALRKLSDMFSELDDPAYVAISCCDHCRDPVTDAVSHMLHDIRSIADVLIKVDVHQFGNVTLPPGRGETPKRLHYWQNPLFLSDESDVD